MGVVGPVLVARGADPRPFAAVMLLVTYPAMAQVIGWLVWFAMRKPRQGPTHRAPVAHPAPDTLGEGVLRRLPGA